MRASPTRYPTFENIEYFVGDVLISILRCNRIFNYIKLHQCQNVSVKKIIAV